MDVPGSTRVRHTCCRCSRIMRMFPHCTARRHTSACSGLALLRLPDGSCLWTIVRPPCRPAVDNALPRRASLGPLPSRCPGQQGQHQGEGPKCTGKRQALQWAARTASAGFRLAGAAWLRNQALLIFKYSSIRGERCRPRVSSWPWPQSKAHEVGINQHQLMSGFRMTRNAPQQPWPSWRWYRPRSPQRWRPPGQTRPG